MFWIALAAQMSAPVASGTRVPDVRAIFSADDFPPYVQAEGVSRTVHTRTTVRPDGSIQSCVAETSSGDTKLDTYTCGLIIKRAKFQPATWIDGTPVYGVIRVPVSWEIRNSPPSAWEMLKDAQVDVELTVNQLPKGAGQIAVVNLEIGADPRGRPVNCAEWPDPLKFTKKHFPELVQVACQWVSANYNAVAPVDQSGKPARSIQTVSVRLTKGH